MLEPGDTPATSAGPIEPGELISGVIDVSGAVDVFSIELASAPALLDLAVAHTDGKSEIWAPCSTLREPSCIRSSCRAKKRSA